MKCMATLGGNGGRGGRECAGCRQVHPRRANICTAVSVANKWPPHHHRHHRRLKERGQQSPHKWLCYGHINPGADTVTYLCPPILISLPENPLAARQLLRCILATSDIAEVKPLSPVWMWILPRATTPPAARLTPHQHTASHTSVHTVLWYRQTHWAACGRIKLAGTQLLVQCLKFPK